MPPIIGRLAHQHSCLVSSGGGGGGGGSHAQVMNEIRRLLSSTANKNSNNCVLPVTRPPQSCSSSPTTTRRIKACETGSGFLLPKYSAPKKSSRVRTRCEMMNQSITTIRINDSSKASSPLLASLDDGLRRRPPERKLRKQSRSMKNIGPWSDDEDDDSLLSSSPSSFTDRISLNMATLSQLLLIGVIFCLLLDAYSTVQTAAQRLEVNKHHEATLMEQTVHTEDYAAHLQEQLSHLSSHADHNLTKTARDMHSEIDAWKREYIEVTKEVHALQDIVQNAARKELESYRHNGDDSAAVRVEIKVPGETDPITIELFDEVPHASWVIVQQIESGYWSQPNFVWDSESHVIMATPATKSGNANQLDFVETSDHYHEAWTVGLTKGGDGRYNLYVNLQDNSDVSGDNDVCLGKIVGGFNALRQLSAGPRRFLRPR